MAAIAVVIILLLINSCGSSSPFSGQSPANQPSMETIANESGVSSTTDPLNAREADRATYPVRDGAPVKSWKELDERYGDDTSYVRCVENTLGIQWEHDVPKFKDIESKVKNKSDGTTIIVAVNVDWEPEKIRAFVKKERPELSGNVPIVMVDETINTMTKDCKRFKDRRSLIRTAQAVPLNDDGTPVKSIADIRRWVYEGCKNPVTLPEGTVPKVIEPSPSGSKSPSASPSPSGSTSSPPPGTTPPATPTPSLETKIPSQGPNVGNGTGNNEGLGDKTKTTQPSSGPREDSDPPKPNVPRPPTVTSTPRPSGSPTPTVNPSGQDNDGWTDPDDCAIC